MLWLLAPLVWCGRWRIVRRLFQRGTCRPRLLSFCSIVLVSRLLVLRVLPCTPVSLSFDSPGFLLTSLSCLSLFVSKSVSQFGDELAAVEADGPYSHPAALDADVAGLDVPFAYAGLGSALEAFGAEVMGLESHLSSIISVVGF